MLPTTAESNNNTGGNGQFGSLLRKRNTNKRDVTSFNLED